MAHRILPFHPDRDSSSAPWWGKGGEGARRGLPPRLSASRTGPRLGDGCSGRPRWGERLTASATLGRVSGRAEGILMPLYGRICADVALL